ncbi:hypothetical protein TL16_g04306 [Triparma laevis f. inornata]|uniref:Uncharacterized protein n=1 Tax=Triparma laevis f. inornata TaxID=1714386 RepID=A0A9W7AAH8_9STRA|nr:hypothetical protein TL16_g04306 [Triparma laevis f. inornata]
MPSPVLPSKLISRFTSSSSSTHFYTKRTNNKSRHHFKPKLASANNSSTNGSVSKCSVNASSKNATKLSRYSVLACTSNSTSETTFPRPPTPSETAYLLHTGTSKPPPSLSSALQDLPPKTLNSLLKIDLKINRRPHKPLWLSNSPQSGVRFNLVNRCTVIKYISKECSLNSINEIIRTKMFKNFVDDTVTVLETEFTPRHSINLLSDLLSLNYSTESNSVLYSRLINLIESNISSVVSSSYNRLLCESFLTLNHSSPQYLSTLNASPPSSLNLKDYVSILTYSNSTSHLLPNLLTQINHTAETLLDSKTHGINQNKLKINLAKEILKSGSYRWGGYNSMFLNDEELRGRVVGEGGWEDLVVYYWCWVNLRLWEVGEGGELVFKRIGDLWSDGVESRDWSYKNRGHVTRRTKQPKSLKGDEDSLTNVDSSESQHVNETLQLLSEAYTISEVLGLHLEPVNLSFHETIEKAKATLSTPLKTEKEKVEVIHLLKNLGVTAVKNYDPRSTTLKLPNSHGLSGLPSSIPGWLSVPVYIPSFKICVLLIPQEEIMNTGEYMGNVKVKVSVLKELGYRVSWIEVEGWKREGFCGRIEILNDCMFGLEEGKSLGLGGRGGIY